MGEEDGGEVGEGDREVRWGGVERDEEGEGDGSDMAEGLRCVTEFDAEVMLIL